MTSEQLLNEIQHRALLSEAVISKLKRDTLISGRSAEAIISDQRLLDDVKVAQVKSEILKVPYQKVDFNNLTAELLALIPEETVRTYAVAPIIKKEDTLIAGMLNPDDAAAQEALKFLAKRARLNLGVFLISYADWQQVLRTYSPYKSEIQDAVRSLHLKKGEGDQKMIELEGGSSSNEDAPVIRIVANTLKEAVQAGASDVHFEPQEKYLRIRFRLDGDLHEVASIPRELTGPVTSRIKVLSELKIDENRIPQDGRFRSKILDRPIDFRVATFPTPLGEKIVIRLLDPTTGLKSFENLGLTGQCFETVQRGLEKPYGMILVTGPTGSGKTTTLYALLQVLNKETVNIVSLEDPVEYFVPGVNQSQVRPEIGYDFASGLRQILRQDPDIIMVGEIRDSETAGLAVNAALTGHIVLSTLHTNNAAGVIPRLIDMKVEPFLLSSSLNLMVAQRLISLLCSKCKKPEETTGPLSQIIQKNLADIPDDLKKGFKSPYTVYRSVGCAVCKGKGIVGRIAMFEGLNMSADLEEIINSGPTSAHIAALQKKKGFLSMRQDGILKALAGLVSIEEVLKETEETT